MVPGMGHCGGGAGPNSFGQGSGFVAGSTLNPERDIVVALEKWVEQGTAPEKLIGTGKALTRPLCVYPQRAHYSGSGDINDAAHFVCTP